MKKLSGYWFKHEKNGTLKHFHTLWDYYDFIETTADPQNWVLVDN